MSDRPPTRIRSLRSRRSFVIIEQATESPAAPNSASDASLNAVDELVVETLMVPLVMIMGHEFGNSPAEMLCLANNPSAVRTSTSDAPLRRRLVFRRQ